MSHEQVGVAANDSVASWCCGKFTRHNDDSATHLCLS